MTGVAVVPVAGHALLAGCDSRGGVDGVVAEERGHASVATPGHARPKIERGDWARIAANQDSAHQTLVSIVAALDHCGMITASVLGKGRFSAVTFAATLLVAEGKERERKQWRIIGNAPNLAQDPIRNLFFFLSLSRLTSTRQRYGRRPE